MTSLTLALVFSLFSLAHGGGTPRLTDAPAGPYRLYAWTQPEPLRAGEIHVTIGVTAASGDGALTGGGDLVQPITDATVTVHFISLAGTTAPIVNVATLGGVGAVYYEADANLPTAEAWRFLVEVQGPDGGGTVEFIQELLPARTVNWLLLGAGGALFVALIVLAGLRNRRQQPETQRM
ncbi:MAG: hypothetical protein KDE53_26490 [Caldilineaceae bacterium]|nr:hypothetical protein [Caldilineaceae bacterium]